MHTPEPDPDTFAGQEIISQAANYRIFRRKKGAPLSWSDRTQPRLPERETAIAELRSTYARAKRKFRGTNHSIIEEIFINGLIKAFTHNDVDVLKLLSSEMHEYIASEPAPRKIISRGDGYVIFIDHEGDFKANQWKEVEGTNESLAEYNRLKALSEFQLSKKAQLKFMQRLAATISAAYKLKPGAGHDKLFSPLCDHLENAIQSEARMEYLLTAGLISVIITMTTVVCYYKQVFPVFINAALVGVAGGTIGAIISVSERAKKLNLKQGESFHSTATNAIARLLIGATFGLISYIAVCSGLALNAFKGDKYSLLILAIIAGFSERLIPDMLSVMASEGKVAERV